MIDLNSRWRSVADRERWATRGATFMGKVKATKAVWFPPTPAKSGKKALSTAKKGTKKATKKSGTAKKTTGTARSATKKTA